MAFHEAHRTTFLARQPDIDIATRLGNAAAYDVGLAPAVVPAEQHCWRVLGVHHLTPAENRGNRHVFVDIVDETGARVQEPNLRLAWGWEGQRADEQANPRAFDKQGNEPNTNVDVYSGQRLWIEVSGDGLASDRVYNMHTNHPDEPGPNGETWNSIGHHSFYVLFQRTRATVAPVEPEPTEPPAQAFRFEAWPTEHRNVTQWFGNDPEGYADYGLPGHEGIDLIAPEGSRIFCVAPGEVKMVERNPDVHNYGIHIRVSHADGYETIYAHLQQALVEHGQTVQAGQVLGLADHTGNSRGDHLHLTLKRQDANTPGYPNNIIDPTPFLLPLLDHLNDAATFVRDMVPDGTEIQTGEAIHQRWLLRNSGTSTWGAGYTLTFQSGERLGAPETIAVPLTAAGQEVELPVTFQAPATPGNYRSVWQLRNAAGAWFGDPLWIDVNVIGADTGPKEGELAVGNKLGFYLHISINHDDLWGAIQRVQPPVIMIHADTANKMLLQEIRRFRAPDAFVIGRMYKDNNTQRMMLDNDNPAAHGRAMAEEILAYDFGLATQRGENGRLLIDAWMGLNEAVPGPGSQQFQEQPEETARLLHNLDRFQVAFRARLQEAGVEAVAFNFGAGNFGSAAHYLDHFPETLANYKYLGFHEYGWPTLYPAAGSATSGGTYRPCMEGIRAQFGDQHRAIITEAGLTRMYQNVAWGDKGWLNHEAPLTQDQYWASLAWYNQQMLQDPYVLGACLYEVGVHGDWVSFRHLGKDAEGQDIRLIDRIVALRDAADVDFSITTTPEPEQVEPITIRGQVTLAGFNVGDAAVRLIGGDATLGQTAGAVLNAPSHVTWTRRMRNIDGTLWSLWQRDVADDVAGISWPEFKERFDHYNPDAFDAENRLQKEQQYWLPENRMRALRILWDRPLAGFSGTLWQCWRQCVQGKVIGLTYEAFKTQMFEQNPGLVEQKTLDANTYYNLPRNQGYKQYALYSRTNSRGTFAFKEMPSGEYELAITTPDAEPFTMAFSCEAETDLAIELLPLTLPTVPADSDLSFDPTAPAPTHHFIQAHNREFVEGGQSFSFVGVNIRGLVHYGDRQTLEHSTPAHREEQLQAAYQMGARVVRVFLPSMHAPADVTIDRLRQVTTLVRERFPGLYLLPAFANLYADVPFRIPGDEGFYGRIDPNWHGDLLGSGFFGGGYSQNYVPFVRQIVTAFKDESAIFAWEVGNELKLNPAGTANSGDPHLRAFINFNHQAAQLIRDLDPNHMVTTGLISTHHCWMHEAELRHQLYKTELFDFLTVHCYNEEYHNDDSGLAAELNKPYIVEEAGFGNSYGGDRSGHVRQDMARWFNSGAQGYMQWGFMATAQDMGDGDGDSGMDRSLHHDWDALFHTYREQANQLAGQRRPLTLPPREIRAAKPTVFAAGDTVYAHTIINVRNAPGHRTTPVGEVLGQLDLGTAATIIGNPVTRDDLIWWPIRCTLKDGQTVDAWAAQSIPGQVLLNHARPL